ncbi:hypothetical protein K490DRAFT_71647 [Saccharata proteae CBS 121410]|uniref:Uncharacterized protein n=1 Tax=Saccharata proteae CBS 121410 TaxID=1314787 RepID=A0A9P4LY56_9PEZI|nr:hypothetical protein K490DRAFT_71647 [Saccharata proteae CBS 121410]
MASDEDYAAFLDKANQDTGVDQDSAASQSFGTKAVNADVPHVLQQVEEYYVSESDEPFEPVSLAWDGDGMPSEADFAKLIGHGSDVSSIDRKEFDPQTQYTKVIETVKKAGSSTLGFFRVEHGSTRAEYYIVSVDKKGGKIVGLKAVAVES